jgi:hypothetical protein
MCPSQQTTCTAKSPVSNPEGVAKAVKYIGAGDAVWSPCAEELHKRALTPPYPRGQLSSSNSPLTLFDDHAVGLLRLRSLGREPGDAEDIHKIYTYPTTASSCRRSTPYCDPKGCEDYTDTCIAILHPSYHSWNSSCASPSWICSQSSACGNPHPEHQARSFPPRTARTWSAIGCSLPPPCSCRP